MKRTNRKAKGKEYYVRVMKILLLAKGKEDKLKVTLEIKWTRKEKLWEIMTGKVSRFQFTVMLSRVTVNYQLSELLLIGCSNSQCCCLFLHLQLGLILLCLSLTQPFCPLFPLLRDLTSFLLSFGRWAYSILHSTLYTQIFWKQTDHLRSEP